MIDFSKRLNSVPKIKKSNPLEIYENLDRHSEVGPLRPTQQKVLDEWYNSLKTNKDLILKLHTGEGKTLVGLLMLQSYINSNSGPCVYVCPNKYLVQQVCDEANKFGIPYCYTTKDNLDLPAEFLEGKKIYIASVQKVFNGKTKFGTGHNSVNIGAILLDDAHACIDSIQQAFSISIKRNHPLYEKFRNIFKDSLVEQGEGSFLELDMPSSQTVLPIPYWSWHTQSSDIISALAQYIDEPFIAFPWQLIKNEISMCQAFISYDKIEISPHNILISKFGSFSNAKHRILMSATTQDDSFFIKGLDISVESIKKPLINTEQKWSGEKMLLLPSLICEEDVDNEIVKKIINIEHTKFGIVVLVPSFRQASKYSMPNVIIANTENQDNIIEIVRALKSGKYEETVVLANRYDGIDLPDASCRILIIDSLPYANSLADHYEERCRPNSAIVNISTAQKIEQGLGRSVRGEKDYSVIIFSGAQLVKFVKGQATNQFFSLQTRKQIEIGLDIAEITKEEKGTNTSSEQIISLINQCLSRDDGWKAYYSQNMNDIDLTNISEHEDIYELLEKEKESESLYSLGDFEGAAAIMQKIADSIEESTEKAWFLQKQARMLFHISPSRANEIQLAAFKRNYEVLKPIQGLSYSKINYPVHDNRIEKILALLKNYNSYQEICLQIESLLSNLSFGVSADTFEKALDSIGDFLGFVCQRPDKEARVGPDNLWCVSNNQYLLIECKSEVNANRKSISKTEAGQMEEHCAWFEKEYGKTNVKNIMIIPTRKLAKDAFFSHDIHIMDSSQLSLFKQSIKGFIQELRTYKLDDLTKETIHNFLVSHNLDTQNIINNYCSPAK